MLQTLELTTVTNFRGTLDYYYGDSWDSGTSFLYIWALNGRPSTDTFWTTDNSGLGPTMHACDKKGCPADHSDAGSALHTIQAFFSTGPVGFSDAIQQTNADRLRAGVRTGDGLLLQPEKPLTTIDRNIVKHQGPNQVMTSFSGVRQEGGYLVFGHYLLAFKMTSPFEVRAADFWPPLNEGSRYAIRRFNMTQQVCEMDTAAADCGISFFTVKAE